MNFHQHQDTHQLPLIKQEGQSDQDTIQTFQDTIHSFQNYQSIPTYPSPQQQQQQQQQPQTYAFQGSTQGNLNSFPAAVPQNQYSLNSHLMGLSMQTAASGAGPASSSLAPLPNNGLMSGVNSGSTTPAMAYASAPSSPILSALQQQFPSGQNAQYNHSSNFYQSPSPQQQQQQQPHPNRYSYQGPHSTQSMSTSSLTSSFYPTSPPQQHQQQHGSTSTSFNAIPPAQVRQQQYPPLVPPLTPAQHAQYHLLLGSALSSAASTPYHSNQSTPYSSMPASPTLDHQQLGDPNLVQKPKRRQVKNACGKQTRVLFCREPIRPSLPAPPLLVCCVVCEFFVHWVHGLYAFVYVFVWCKVLDQGRGVSSRVHPTACPYVAWVDGQTQLKLFLA
ncbi:hypothetical protein B0O80DRAFT_265696 [Mortierella sp. GBAus27b]|nr:hypothetical protein B0O80DRAFT_265696 [Mortierella sp. GBAus27b]